MLLSQAFLALGWLRAAAAHAVSASWWRGTELEQFLVINSENRLPIYDVFASEVIVPAADVVAVTIVVIEIGIGLALLFDYRPAVALALGMTLNVHFVAAGSVNPSVFYLVIGLGLLVWHHERSPEPVASRRNAKRVATLAAVTTLLLGPQVGTVAPADVIEDPAIILIFLTWLVALAFWSISSRALEHTSAAIEPVGDRRRTTDVKAWAAPLERAGASQVDHDGSVRRGLPGLLR